MNMKQELFDGVAIEKVLDKIRSPRNNIGTYVQHTVTEDGDHLVDVTNGRIRLYTVELMDGDNLMPHRIQEIAERFRSRNMSL